MKQHRFLGLAIALLALPAAAQAQSAAAGSMSSPGGIGTSPVSGAELTTTASTMTAPAPVTPGISTAAPVAKPAKIAATPVFEHPVAGIGQPTDAIGIQPQVTAIGREAEWMHNIVLMPIITAISLFVLGLLLWVVMRYRRAASPVPSRTSHNTVLEVAWTLAPVLILLVIAVPSIKLLANQYNPPKADLTVKVIGHQWYWSYEYPDNGDFEVVSNILPEKADAKPGDRFRTDDDGPRMLAVDEHMVVPAGAVVKVITTSDDVIHSFAVPAFWVKMDAVPGRLNETWFKVDRPGLYFGQCSELCGARHGYMPIAVEVVPRADFALWIKAKGGTLPGPGVGRATSSDATANSPVSNPTAGSGAESATAATVGAAAVPTTATENASAAATGTSQGATAN